MGSRLATHAGSWYTGNASRLEAQLSQLFEQAKENKASLTEDQDCSKVVKGARVLIGPHAGYLFSASRLAETFNVWDTSKVKRVFILGPSHHVYFKNYAMISQFDNYETPLGLLPVDKLVCQHLATLTRSSGKSATFKYMSLEVDEDEHSFEMHAPLLYYRSRNLPQGVPKIIPIMISGMDDAFREDLVSALTPFFQDEENTFVISSDFCHWGSRFGYTEYLEKKPEGRISFEDLISLRPYSKMLPSSLPIHQSISYLDKTAMQIASTGSQKAWKDYIYNTGNTICGQKPIEIVLSLLEKHNESKSSVEFNKGFFWIGYSQSSEVTRPNDSSVSYASGFAIC